MTPVQAIQLLMDGPFGWLVWFVILLTLFVMACIGFALLAAAFRR